jgi:hypothetical protein
VLWSAGGGRRAAGTAGNTPAGLAADAAGNVTSSTSSAAASSALTAGHIPREYSHLGGAGARPAKDVAIDAIGNVYVSDSVLAAVPVFGAEGGTADSSA